MTTSELLDLLIHSISSEDWQRLDRNDPSLVISRWNLKTLQRLRGYHPAPGTIPVDEAEELRLSLSRYMDRYMPEKPEGHHWIIISCLFLAFIAREPLHPQEIVRHRQVLKDGRRSFLCPAREESAESLCRCCVCEKDERKQGVLFVQ
jgi:uncharacterized protein (UPF0305 family)